MLGQKDRSQPELFVAGSLRALLPDDYILVRVDRVLDLSWLRAEVSDCYSLDKGRPGIDPEAAVRLMLAGLLLGIVHDRCLMREAQVNLAIRWFTGYALHEVLPDHSSLTRIRQRWGAERFRQIFERTVQALRSLASIVTTCKPPFSRMTASVVEPPISIPTIIGGAGSCPARHEARSAGATRATPRQPGIRKSCAILEST